CRSWRRPMQGWRDCQVPATTLARRRLGRFRAPLAKSTPQVERAVYSPPGEQFPRGLKSRAVGGGPLGCCGGLLSYWASAAPLRLSALPAPAGARIGIVCSKISQYSSTRLVPFGAVGFG